MKPRTSGLLLTLHLYLGLLFAAYLVVYGLTALAFNHKIGAPQTRTTWETRVETPVARADLRMAVDLRRSLGLFGAMPAGKVKRNESGELSFTVRRPGRHYKIRYRDGLARVQETDTGVLGVVQALHGLGMVPGSLWGATWGLYTEVSFWAVCLSVLTGATLWWRRRTDRRLGAVSLALGAGGGLALMLALWW